MREWNAGVETDKLRCRFPSFLKARIWTNKASPFIKIGQDPDMCVWVTSILTLLKI